MFVIHIDTNKKICNEVVENKSTYKAKFILLKRCYRTYTKHWVYGKIFSSTFCVDSLQPEVRYNRVSYK